MRYFLLSQDNICIFSYFIQISGANEKKIPQLTLMDF